MSDMLRASLVAVLVIVPLASAAQPSTNFSGDWVLVSATVSGTRGRGEAETSKASGERRTMGNTASGARLQLWPRMYDRAQGQTLTIDRALLGSNVTAAPAVTLPLDGRQTPVVDSFNPGRRIPTTAKWNGDTLENTSSTGASAFTQLLSVEAAELVVITSVAREANSPVTWRYRRR